MRNRPFSSIKETFKCLSHSILGTADIINMLLNHTIIINNIVNKKSYTVKIGKKTFFKITGGWIFKEILKKFHQLPRKKKSLPGDEWNLAKASDEKQYNFSWPFVCTWPIVISCVAYGWI